MTQGSAAQRTKHALAESLKKAMKSKPFQKITVTELIRDCGVNRKTFYYHFSDIYALLKWMLEDETINMIRNYDLLVDYEEVIVFVMNYVEENDHIINCAYDAIGSDQLKLFFVRDFLEIVRTLIENAEEKLGVRLDDSYREFLTYFYTEAIAGILIVWIREREYRDRDAIVRYLVGTIKESLIGILQHSPDCKPARNPAELSLNSP